MNKEKFIYVWVYWVFGSLLLLTRFPKLLNKLLLVYYSHLSPCHFCILPRYLKFSTLFIFSLVNNKSSKKIHNSWGNHELFTFVDITFHTIIILWHIKRSIVSAYLLPYDHMPLNHLQTPLWARTIQ